MFSHFHPKFIKEGFFYYTKNINYLPQPPPTTLKGKNINYLPQPRTTTA